MISIRKDAHSSEGHGFEFKKQQFSLVVSHIRSSTYYKISITEFKKAKDKEKKNHFSIKSCDLQNFDFISCEFNLKTNQQLKNIYNLTNDIEYLENYIFKN